MKTSDFERVAAGVITMVQMEVWLLDWWPTWLAMFHGTHLA